MLVVSLGGSPSQRSRSGVLLERSQRWLQQQGVEVVSYQVRDFPAKDLLHARFDSPKVVDLLAQIENADGLLIATPVYKASFSGALKTVLDLLPERALAHKVVLPMATGGSIAHMLAVVARSCAWVIAALLLIALADVPYQVWALNKKLRMSRQDVKEEHKESEGDPHVKGRIRQQQRSMARSRMMSQVPGADVVVTNPTHYAVALKYQDGKSRAPRVVAKGTGLIAAKIRGLAAVHKVATLEAPALARALYFNVELEREIPVDLYSAVAEVLAYVFQLRHFQQVGGAYPNVPTALPVPPELDPLRLSVNPADPVECLDAVRGDADGQGGPRRRWRFWASARPPGRRRRRDL